MTGPSDSERAAALDAIARRYDWYETSGYADRWGNGAVSLVQSERDRWVLAALGAGPPATVLDVGCADGTVGMLLDRAGVRPRRLLGIDLLPARIEAARRNVPWGQFTACSADSMPFEASTIDVAVAMTLLSSLREDWLRRATAQEIARVLRPGGRLIVYDLRYPSPRNRAVHPVSLRELRLLFPGWTLRATSLTLLPPLARSRVAGGRRRYQLLASIPILRSHIGAVLVKPR